MQTGNDFSLVAEAGCNHQGRVDLALRMIEASAATGVLTHLKFQKRNVHELLSEETRAMPHPRPEHAFGETYGRHRDHLEFDLETHRRLKRHCEDLGLGYACSVWDVTSAREIASLNPGYIKVPSAANLNFPLLDVLCQEYAGDLHISLGMTTRQEIVMLTAHLRRQRALPRTVLYACTSAYPTPRSQVCLREIAFLKETFGHEVRGLGFSGHHQGVLLDVAAYAMGARWIERHFTLDRTLKGTDQALSLQSEDLLQLHGNLAEVREAMGTKESGLTEGELAQRRWMKVPMEAFPH